MREKKTRFRGMGLVAAVAMLGSQAGAAVLVYDGFDSAATADAANGVYANDWLTNAPNPEVAGGNMVGIQASDTWTAHADYRIDDGKIGLKDSWVRERKASRAITVDMSGKTVAWASAIVSAYLPDYGNGNYPMAVVGFSDSNFGSAAGAGLGFRWNHDTEQWNISTRHLNGGWAYGTVQASVGTDTGEFYLLWKMDDAANELSVWVNPTDTNTAPTAVFAFDGQVGNITHMNLLTYRLNDTLIDSINMFTVDELRLGETMQDVFIDYTPGLLAFEGFDTADTADAANGIYQTGVSFTNAANANVAGGNMIGFQSSDAWSAGSKTCDYLMPMNGKGGAKIIVSDSEKHATRAIAESLSGKTVLWQSATMSVDYDYGAVAGTNAVYNPIAVAGYGGYDVLYRVGAYLGFRWDGSNWDLVARYKNTAGSAVWQVVKENLGTTVADTFLVWKMDDANDELSIWIDAAETNAAPDVVLADYANTVGNIVNINIFTYRLGRSEGGHHAFLVDDLKLGETMLSVMPRRIVGYSGWAETWGVDIGASSADYDGDGLINLHEYGLDGDPTNALDQGTSPELSIATIGGANWLYYIHPQRAASDSGLTYYLETSTDLVTGTWTNTGYAVAGTNDTGGVLDFVTNVADMAESGKFIRLKIVEE